MNFTQGEGCIVTYPDFISITSTSFFKSIVFSISEWREILKFVRNSTTKMNYLREFLYRPKRSDRSLIARFFHADEALTAVASELDSFDGRKDPERCASLVNKLRSCQVLQAFLCLRTNLLYFHTSLCLSFLGQVVEHCQ